MPTLSETQKQLIPFAAVGIISTVVHILLVTIMVNFLSLKPLTANIIAYTVTVNISYLGHKYITFAGLEANKSLRLPHFLLISVTAFILNEFLYFLFLQYTRINYFFSLVIVIGLVAIFTFVASKWWACR